MFSPLPVPVINIFSVSSFFYNPSRISFAPFSHFIPEKHTKSNYAGNTSTRSNFPDPVPSEFSRNWSAQNASWDSISRNPVFAPSAFQSSKRFSNMAEENGVAEVNGKTEELAIENGECDEEEKGSYLLILQWLYFECGIVRRIFYKYSLCNLHFTWSSWMMRYDDNKVFKLSS